MPRRARERCYCGCGQAPGVTCRQRLVECDGCGIKARMSRETVALVVLSCSCGGTLVPPCLEDRARSGDEDAWSQLSARMQRSAASREAGLRSGQARRNRAAAAAMTADEITFAVGGEHVLTAQAARAVAERQRADRIGKVAGDDLPF